MHHSAGLTDEELANAAAVHFGGRARAEHWLTCEHCFVRDDGRPQLCPGHPDRAGVDRTPR